MAGDALGGGGMRPLGDQPIQSPGVALAANFRVMADGLPCAWSPMGIMTGIAGQRFLAGDETSGLPKPVGGAADDLKLVITGAGRMIERQHERAQRLASGEGERPAIEPPDQGWNRGAGRLQVTLHAEIHPQLRTEPGRIHDAGANLFTTGARGLRRANVIAAGAVTPLAIDAFGKVAGKYRLATRSIVPGRNTRVFHRGKKCIHTKPAAG